MNVSEENRTNFKHEYQRCDYSLYDDGGEGGGMSILQFGGTQISIICCEFSFSKINDDVH